MRAGVRPGLQILRACLWRADRFDSDALPPRRLFLFNEPETRSAQCRGIVDRLATDVVRATRARSQSHEISSRVQIWRPAAVKRELRALGLTTRVAFWAADAAEIARNLRDGQIVPLSINLLLYRWPGY